MYPSRAPDPLITAIEVDQSVGVSLEKRGGTKTTYQFCGNEDS